MDVTISAGFSSRPYDARLRVYTRAVSGNSSAYHGDRYGYSRSGYGSYNNDSHSVSSWIAGQGYGASGIWFKFAPGDFAGKTIGWGGWDTGFIGHDGNGSLNFTSRIQVPSVSPFGSADTGDVWMSADRIPAVPGAPGIPSISAATPTSVTLSWGAAARGHADTTGYQWQMSIDPAFGSQVAAPVLGNVLSDSTADNVTLTPGTVYYVHVRALNSDGWSGWSPVRSFSTLPATAPGMVVTPGVSGRSASVALTPPGGATGVTKYTVEYRLLGTTTATSVDTTVSPLYQDGLTQGATYEWRSSAWFGTYQSPWTSWSAVVQPNPNTNPGDYFDGSTAPRGDLTFAWTGTANNSTSTANGVGVDGWSALSTAGGTVRLQRVTGGFSGSYAARMLVITDCTGAGTGLGMDRTATAKQAAVTEDGTYVGSIYVRPSRTQRMYAEITWYNESAVEVGTRIAGPEAIVTDTAGWTRLTATGICPTGATRAVVRVRDVAGAMFSPWLSGETLDGDAAMVTLAGLFDYFDGSTPDDPNFDYAWLGTPNASGSVRNVLVASTEDPLADPDCPPPPTPPALPSIPDDCIIEVGTWRRYTVAIPAINVPLWASALPTLILNTAGVAERQVRIRYYPNPDALPDAQVANGDFDSEMILTYVPPNTEIRLDGVTQAVTATVGSSTPIPANRLLRGTGGVPATWPDLRCGIGYVVTLDVPIDAPSGNLTTRLIITQRA